MGLFSTIGTAATGLTAQRMRLDVIADNMANVNTTRTPEGGPFRRSQVVLRPKENSPQWYSPFTPASLDQGIGEGVVVTSIEKDLDSEPILKYDPSHPDAIKTGPNKGMVMMPNINPTDEMVDMIAASRSYEANLSVIDGAKSMFNRALEIGR